MPRYGKLISVVIFIFFGCATTGINKFQPNVFSTEQEVQIGENFAQEVEKQNKIFQDPQWQAYLDTIGQKIVQYCDRPNITYHFKIIDEPKQVNAFSLPGGYIYVYTGLLLKADNEAELAGVLAHEIGHVAARHATERLTLLYGYQLGVSLLLGENPSEIQKLVANLFGTGGLLAYGRKDEYEADRLGVKYSSAAGYDPQGLVSFLGKLKDMESHEPGLLEQLLSTHPPAGERIKRAKEYLARLPVKSGAVNAQGYLKMKRKLKKRLKRKVQ